MTVTKSELNRAIKLGNHSTCVGCKAIYGGNICLAKFKLSPTPKGGYEFSPGEPCSKPNTYKKLLLNVYNLEMRAAMQGDFHLHSLKSVGIKEEI